LDCIEYFGFRARYAVLKKLGIPHGTPEEPTRVDSLLVPCGTVPGATSPARPGVCAFANTEASRREATPSQLNSVSTFVDPHNLVWRSFNLSSQQIHRSSEPSWDGS